MKRGNLVLIGILLVIVLFIIGCGGAYIGSRTPGTTTQSNTPLVNVTCEDTEILCTDGIDNDCDGLIDCFDSECSGQSCGGLNVCVSSGGCCVDSDLDNVCDGLLLDYTFDDDNESVANDFSGNGLTGNFISLRGNMISQWASGVKGTSGDSALDFDGINDYLSLGGKPEFNTNQLTVEAWINLDSFGGFKPIIVKDGQYLLRINNEAEGNRLAFFVKINGQWEPRVQTPPAEASDLGKWIHVAGVFDGVKLRLFANGQLIQERDRPGNIDVTNNPLLIGKWGPSYFDGRIDEIRISNIARYTSDFTPSKDLSSDSNTLTLLKFNQRDGGIALDRSGYDNHVVFWPQKNSAITPNGKGKSLALDADTIETVPLGAGTAAEAIRDGFTASFWLYPTENDNVLLPYKPGSFAVLKAHRNIVFNINIQSQINHFHNFRTWDNPLELNKWNHVATSYDGLTKTAKIIVNNKVVVEEQIPVEEITANHSGSALLNLINQPFKIGRIENERSMKGFVILDDFKLYDSAKDCFDLNDDGLDECSLCQTPDIVVEVSPGEAHLSDEVCPVDAMVVREAFSINTLNLNTKLYDTAIAPNECKGKSIVLSYANLGSREVKVNTTSSKCQIGCTEECITEIIPGVYQDCINQCTRYCENGACLSHDYQTYCGGDDGVPINSCQMVLRKTPGDKTNFCGESLYYPTNSEDSNYTYPKYYKECCKVTLNSPWIEDTTTEYCSTQCNTNYNQLDSETSYSVTCPFELNKIVTIRGGSRCSGQIISSYPLEGIGSQNLYLNLPTTAGNYEVCVDDQSVWSGTVSDPYCPNLGCILEADDKYMKPGKGQVLKTLFTLTNIGQPANYDLKLYSKINTEETPDTATGPVPDWVEIEVEDIAYPPLALSADESGEFTLNINPPEHAFKLNNCYSKRGKAGKECPKYEVTGNNDLPFYDNLILRAESDTGFYCEYPFDLDLSDVCKEEGRNDCNNNDEDCDGLVDEAIIEVEVVRQDGPGKIHGNEPLEGVKVNFYRYFENQDPVETRQNSCMDDNSLSTNSDYQAIVNTCKPADASCRTDENGYCNVEVEIKDHPDHYMAIAVIDNEGEGFTDKHLGLPVSGINCGQEKKTWHLAWMV